MNIDGKAAPVETATWIGSRDTLLDAAPPESSPLSARGAPIALGRLVVFLFQKDLEPSRMIGLIPPQPSWIGSQLYYVSR